MAYYGIHPLRRGFAAIAAAVLALASFSRPFDVYGAGPAPAQDPNIYTLVLQYTDAIQLRYRHLTGGSIDSWWVGTGDVPVGGAYLGGPNGTQVIPQVYCVDAAVPFHSWVNGDGQASYGAGTSHETGRNPLPATHGFTTDVAPGYVVAAPNQIPTRLAAHWQQLSWLVSYGYSDAASMAYLTTIPLSDGRGPLPNLTTADYDVAVMATKTAVWHYTNPDVAYISTGFLTESGGDPDSPNGIKHRQFNALMQELIARADAYALSPTPDPLYSPAPLQIAFDYFGAGTAANPAPTYSGTDSIYGPYSVRDVNAIGITERVFLSMADTSNPGGASVVFLSNAGTDASPSPGAPLPLDLPAYGSNDPSPLMGPGVQVGEKFYIKAPTTLPLHGLSINGYTRAAGVSADPLRPTMRVPVVLVNQDLATGAQDWEAVQAFIGAADSPVTVYGATAQLLTEMPNELTVSKESLQGAGPGPYLMFLSDYLGMPVDLSTLTVSPASMASNVVDAQNGMFLLSGGDIIQFSGLPFGTYHVTELFSPTVASHSSDGGATFKRGNTAKLEFTYDAITPGTADIRFRNVPEPLVVLLEKVSTDPGNPRLAQAMFTLASPALGYEETQPTGENGGIIFDSLPTPGGSSAVYTLTETKAPAGYSALNGPINIAINPDGTLASVTPDPADATRVSAGGIGSNTLRLSVADEPLPTPPATPSQPDKPDHPATPSQPDHPDQPDHPATPSQPDQPQNPDTPPNPATPGTPTTPDTPDNPHTPGVPSNPTTPDTPDYPVTPGTPETPKPSTPIVPPFPFVPENPLTPASPGNPSGHVQGTVGTTTGDGMRRTSPKTGDGADGIFWAWVWAAAQISLLLLLTMRRKSDKM
ncbi:MAG: Cys-Gln thioester bond-forming surface protein [Lachnospiraceae bacterium]|jgi:hypothetical protein|nr:Cys-Gln thioester bond-forming surface protein [Lachnospiraceae bacterium]